MSPRVPPRERLIEARDHLLDAAVSYFKQQPEVVGIFLAGSIPAGRADEWSDIDLRVLVRPEAHAAFLARREEHPRSWGDLAFNVAHPGTIHCVSHFRPFVKIDVFYYPAEKFAPSPWHNLPLQILFDPDGIVAAAVTGSKNLNFEPDPRHVTTRINLGIATAHEVYRRAHRGELIYAQNLLESLRHILAELDACFRGRPFTNIERDATPGLVDTLRKSYVHAERDAILAALEVLISTFKNLVAGLDRKFALGRDLSSDIAELDRVSVL